MTKLTEDEAIAIKKVLENCNCLDITDEDIQRYLDNYDVTINTCRNGRDVAWAIFNDEDQSCVYVDTLEELSEEEIERELC